MADTERKLSLENESFVCSWSGGKDSCLALHQAVSAGGRPAALFNMLAENGETSRSHALPKNLLQAQADALNIPLHFASASWQDYEAVFIAALKQFKLSGIHTAVFGDIDIESHRQWVHKVCSAAGIQAFHPLWQRERKALVTEFIQLDYKASIIVVNNRYLDNRFLTKNIDAGTIDEIEKCGADACGENGEYHSVVTDGPLFQKSVPVKFGAVYSHQGYGFAPCRLSASENLPVSDLPHRS